MDGEDLVDAGGVGGAGRAETSHAYAVRPDLDGQRPGERLHRRALHAEAVALRTFHRPAGDWPDTAEVRLDDRHYRVGTAGGSFVITPGGTADAVVRTGPDAFVAALGPAGSVVQFAGLRATPQN